MTCWPLAGLVDDLRPMLAAARAAEHPVALATITAVSGGPRPPGTQMLIAADQAWGFLSGGCIEADVTRHGHEVIGRGEARRLRYGTGSPFIDIRLTCGGWIEVLIERLAPDDESVAAILAAESARRLLWWESDGDNRQTGFEPFAHPLAPAHARRLWQPGPRIVVVGGDPYGLAIAQAGLALDWGVTLLVPGGPAQPPFPVDYNTESIEAALEQAGADRWTALAVASHDNEQDDRAIIKALAGKTMGFGYVGLLGSRRKLAERLALYRRSGCADPALSTLRAPIGLPMGGDSPRAVALSVTAEILATFVTRGVSGEAHGRQAGNGQ